MFTAIRVNEACTLLSEDVYDSLGRVRSHLTIRKKNTKRKLATRTLPIIQELRTILAAYEKEAGFVYLFPGRRGGHTAYSRFMKYSSSNWQTSFVNAQDLLSRVQ